MRSETPRTNTYELDASINFMFYSIPFLIIVYNIIIFTMALILIIFIFIIIRAYTNFITMLMTQALSLSQLPCSKYTNAHAQWNSIWCPIRDEIFVVLVVETVFFHSIWRYHLDTCSSTNKKMICLENNMNNNITRMKILPVLPLAGSLSYGQSLAI